MTTQKVVTEAGSRKLVVEVGSQRLFGQPEETVLVVTKSTGRCGVEVSLTRAECTALVAELLAFAASEG